MNAISNITSVAAPHRPDHLTIYHSSCVLYI